MEFNIVPVDDPCLVLDVGGASMEEGAGLILWAYNGQDNQRFKLHEDGHIEAVHSGLMLDIYRGEVKGRYIIQWPKHDGSNQKWTFHRDGTIRSPSGLCLDVQNVEEGTEVIVSPPHGGSSQKWYLVKAEERKLREDQEPKKENQKPKKEKQKPK